MTIKYGDLVRVADRALLIACMDQAWGIGVGTGHQEERGERKAPPNHAEFHDIIDRLLAVDAQNEMHASARAKEAERRAEQAERRAEQYRKCLDSATGHIDDGTKAIGQLATVRKALDALTYAAGVVLCEYGSAGVPMIERMAAATDAARLALRDTAEGKE